MEEGTLKFGFSSSYPNENTFISASPFSWFEATYRYSEVKNLLYGPAFFSGNQSWKDKGFDVKFRLSQESYFIPAIALGLRDIAGTGAFSSEYIVASKVIGDFDITAGLGWGNLGQLNNISNPLIDLDADFSVRNSELGQGGGLNYKDWFSGENAALFGGLEYSLRKYGLRLKLEYDTSKPDVPFNKRLPLEVDSRFNIGLSYNINNFADLGFSFERGNQFRFSFTFRGNFSDLDSLRKSDPPYKLTKKDVSSPKTQDYLLIHALKELKEEAIFLQGGSINEEIIDISVSQSRFRSQPLAIGRTARILSALSSEEIDWIIINIMNGDMETSSIKLPRKDFKKATNKEISIKELELKTIVYSASDKQKYLDHNFKPRVNFPEYSWSMSPSLKHHIGGPEAFYLGQLWWRVNSNIKINRNLSLSTVLGLDIYNNFDELDNQSASTLPHVRSDIQEYLKQGSSNIARMKLDYIWSPREDLFMRADFGLIEEMFGGIGGEVLYRPFNSRYAFGLTGHYLKQRKYNQRLGFKEYQVFSSHLNSYFKLPGETLLQVHAGRYLAKDYGVTIDISRRFDTGFRLGAFVTKTDVSKKEFGEGSFDKGFYFNIPIDLFFQKYKNGNISFAMHPLTRDGGAMLNNHNSLYGIFGDTTSNALERDFGDIIK